MIVGAADLDGLRGTVTMVDGGFDPLHPGHIAYFSAAAALGLPLLCSVAPDAWVARKHEPLLDQAERCEVIDAIRQIAYTFPSNSSTEDVLRALRPRFYAKGADWRDRLPAGEIAACAEHEVEIIFLDTVLASSSEILQRFKEHDRHA